MKDKQKTHTSMVSDVSHTVKHCKKKQKEWDEKWANNKLHEIKSNISKNGNRHADY